MTKSGWNLPPNVCCSGLAIFCLAMRRFLLEQVLTSIADSFKDETDQTAAEYHVLPVTGGQSASRSPSEARSTPSSIMDPSFPGPSSSVPFYVAESRGGSRSASAHSPRSISAPVSVPRLANVNEAYLLRHFQRHLAPWVSTLPNREPCAFANLTI